MRRGSGGARGEKTGLYFSANHGPAYIDTLSRGALVALGMLPNALKPDGLKPTIYQDLSRDDRETYIDLDVLRYMFRIYAALEDRHHSTHSPRSNTGKISGSR